MLPAIEWDLATPHNSNKHSLISHKKFKKDVRDVMEGNLFDLITAQFVNHAIYRWIVNLDLI